MLAADGEPCVILRIFLINDEKILSLKFGVAQIHGHFNLSCLDNIRNSTGMTMVWLDSDQRRQDCDRLVLPGTDLLALG